MVFCLNALVLVIKEIHILKVTYFQFCPNGWILIFINIEPQTFHAVVVLILFFFSLIQIALGHAFCSTKFNKDGTKLKIPSDI